MNNSRGSVYNCDISLSSTAAPVAAHSERFSFFARTPGGMAGARLVSVSEQPIEARYVAHGSGFG